MAIMGIIMVLLVSDIERLDSKIKITRTYGLHIRDDAGMSP